jgi:uncharacterized protein (UPF0332 family)
MTFDWRKFFELAQDLASRRDSEASLRSAVSRAYYAVHCSARDLARLNTSGARDAHKIVIEYYENRRGRAWSVGNTLAILLRERKHADYDDAPAVTPAKASTSIIRAQTALENLAKLTDRELRSS